MAFNCCFCFIGFQIDCSFLPCVTACLFELHARHWPRGTRRLGSTTYLVRYLYCGPQRRRDHLHVFIDSGGGDLNETLEFRIRESRHFRPRAPRLHGLSANGTSVKYNEEAGRQTDIYRKAAKPKRAADGEQTDNISRTKRLLPKPNISPSPHPLPNLPP